MKLKQDRIRFGAYTPMVIPSLAGVPMEDQIRDLAEGGIDYAVLWFDDFGKFDREKQLKVLDLFLKHGIEAVYFDDAITSRHDAFGKDHAMMFDKEKAAAADYYRDHPAFVGHSFVDEPGTAHYDDLGKTVADYQKIFPGKCPYINLLPMYANPSQLTGGAWMEKIDVPGASATTYQKYLDEYIEKVPTDYICVDIYPCHTRNGLKTTYGGYVRNIEIVADACRRSNRAFWCCVQSCSWDPSVRVPDEADYRWQIYTMLSYGVTNLFDYVYATRPNHKGAPLGPSGEKTPLWFYKRRVANEVKAISDEFVQYKNLGAFAVNCTEDTPYLRMENPYKNFDAIEKIECGSPLLVGCFEKKNGAGNAFTLVNMTDLAKPACADVRIKVKGTPVSHFGGIARREIAGEDGYYRFTLDAGDGVFVVVE